MTAMNVAHGCDGSQPWARSRHAGKSNTKMVLHRPAHTVESYHSGSTQTCASDMINTNMVFWLQNPSAMTTRLVLRNLRCVYDGYQFGSLVRLPASF